MSSHNNALSEMETCSNLERRREARRSRQMGLGWTAWKGILIKSIMSPLKFKFSEAKNLLKHPHSMIRLIHATSARDKSKQTKEKPSWMALWSTWAWTLPWEENLTTVKKKSCPQTNVECLIRLPLTRSLKSLARIRTWTQKLTINSWMRRARAIANATHCSRAHPSIIHSHAWMSILWSTPSARILSRMPIVPHPFILTRKRSI